MHTQLRVNWVCSGGPCSSQENDNTHPPTSLNCLEKLAEWRQPFVLKALQFEVVHRNHAISSYIWSTPTSNWWRPKVSLKFRLASHTAQTHLYYMYTVHMYDKKHVCAVRDNIIWPSASQFTWYAGGHFETHKILFLCVCDIYSCVSHIVHASILYTQLMYRCAHWIISGPWITLLFFYYWTWWRLSH